MGHKSGETVPVDFVLSPQTCSALVSDLTCITTDVGDNLLKTPFSDAEAGCKPTLTFSETTKEDFDGIEYRVTLDLHVGKVVNADSFNYLVSLVIGTANALFSETNGQGFGTVRLKGVVNGTSFETHLTYYAFVDGIARQC